MVPGSRCIERPEGTKGIRGQISMEQYQMFFFLIRKKRKWVLFQIEVSVNPYPTLKLLLRDQVLVLLLLNRLEVVPISSLGGSSVALPLKAQNRSGTHSNIYTSWKNICLLGRKLDDISKLNFVPLCKLADGDLIVKIDKSEVEINAQKWESTHIGYVLGDKTFYSHLKARVTRLWKPTCSLEIHSRENGYFFFKFGNTEECTWVLQSGP